MCHEEEEEEEAINEDVMWIFAKADLPNHGACPYIVAPCLSIPLSTKCYGCTSTPQPLEIDIWSNNSAFLFPNLEECSRALRLVNPSAILLQFPRGFP